MAETTGGPEPHRPPARTVADRTLAGRQARQRVRRRELGDWEPDPGRDPLGILRAQEQTRVPELVTLRHQRMAESPFAFFRGAAAVFAADLAPRPRTGLQVQLCGDAHLVNFGAFASPERSLVFDLNDFDETLPGPFEWDLARLAASFEVAGRANGFVQRDREEVQRTLARAYAVSMQRFSTMHHLDVWYERLSVAELVEVHGAEAGPAVVARVNRNMAKAMGKDRLKALRRLTVEVDGELRFASDPPLLQPASELFGEVEHDRLFEILHDAIRAYRRSLQPDRRHLLERYRFVDLARKVVGVGSVGTRCWVALLVGVDNGDPLFLQVKEAEPSVLAEHLGASVYVHQGRRVVEGQRLVQSASDILLGWERVTGTDGRAHDYYFRQLWDWKASAAVEEMSPTLMALYAKLCAHTLARAHARSGDSLAISTYLGGGAALGRAMVRFAAAYADQNERDHAALVAWMAEQGEEVRVP